MTGDVGTEVSKFGYNPTLERRLQFKLINCQVPGQGEEKRLINVNYLICDPIYETAFRSDVRRVETSAKMAIRPHNDLLREEEFCNVNTSMRESINIMLVKKFETFYTNRLSNETEEELNAAQKIYNEEVQRKMKARDDKPLSSRSLIEEYEDKNIIKVA